MVDQRQLQVRLAVPRSYIAKKGPPRCTRCLDSLKIRHKSQARCVSQRHFFPGRAMLQPRFWNHPSSLLSSCVKSQSKDVKKKCNGNKPFQNSKQSVESSHARPGGQGVTGVLNVAFVRAVSRGHRRISFSIPLCPIIFHGCGCLQSEEGH